MEKIELILDIELRYAKYGDSFKCICAKHKLLGKSNSSFAEAEEKLFEQIGEKIWLDEFTVKPKISIIGNK